MRFKRGCKPVLTDEIRPGPSFEYGHYTMHAIVVQIDICVYFIVATS